MKLIEYVISPAPETIVTSIDIQNNEERKAKYVLYLVGFSFDGDRSEGGAGERGRERVKEEESERERENERVREREKAREIMRE